MRGHKDQSVPFFTGRQAGRPEGCDHGLGSLANFPVGSSVFENRKEKTVAGRVNGHIEDQIILAINLLLSHVTIYLSSSNIDEFFLLGFTQRWIRIS